jgi:thiol:disulfide interchange protein
MHRLLQWLLWGVLGALAVACAGPTTELLSTTPASGTQDIASTATLAAPRYVYTPSEFDLLYYPTDLNIVGSTGRPQFINAYADWCRECQANRPIVHGLQAVYGDRVDFLHVDVENPGALEAVGPYGITGRTQYLLMDGSGNVLRLWFGTLDQDELEGAFEALLNG